MGIPDVVIDSKHEVVVATRAACTVNDVSYHLNQFEWSDPLQTVDGRRGAWSPTDVGLRPYKHGHAIRNQLLTAQETITMQATSTFSRRLLERIWGQRGVAPHLQSASVAHHCLHGAGQSFSHLRGSVARRG